MHSSLTTDRVSSFKSPTWDFFPFFDKHVHDQFLSAFFCKMSKLSTVEALYFQFVDFPLVLGSLCAHIGFLCWCWITQLKGHTTAPLSLEQQQG